MAMQVLNKSTPSNRVDHVDQRNKINANFTELHEKKVDKETGKSLVSNAEKNTWNAKQDPLTLKTVNGESIVGTGNIEVAGSVPDATLEVAGKVKVRGYTGTGAPVVYSTEGADGAFVGKEDGKSLVTDAERTQWNNASIGSDLGLLKTTDTPPPTGTHKGDVNAAGTYTNFKDASSVSISFTAPELVDNYGFIYVKDNVATKSLVAKKGFGETASTDNLLLIVDVNGNVIGGWDNEGGFFTNYTNQSIPVAALSKEINYFFKDAQVSQNYPEFLNLVADANGNILGGWKTNGAFYAVKIEAGTIDGKMLNGSGEEITKETYLSFATPQYLVSLDLEGTLPTDESEARVSTDMIATFRQGDVFLFKSKVDVKIQGHGSVGLPKKGYGLSFFNASGSKLNIKWGDMHAVDSINIKAFHTDPTHAKDITAGRIWKSVRTSRPFPNSYIADFSNVNTVNNKDYLYQDDALFYADGFPMRMTLNSSFYGLYTWKLKKKRENYRMDGANKKNIFLDSTGNGSLTLTDFTPIQWDVKSPKISGYEEGGAVTDTVVLASINRFFNWTNACVAGTTNMRDTYADYINLESVLDYYITCEMLNHWDAKSNNTELMTWDGLKWSFCIYDADQTMGTGTGVRLSPTSMVMVGSFWIKIKDTFLAEIKARYTELRKDIFTMNNFNKEYSKIPALIGAKTYDDNLKKWGWRIDDGTFTSVRDILSFAQAKLTYLDSYWLLP